MPAPSVHFRSRAVLTIGALFALAHPAASQLRPLDPAPWSVFDAGRSVVARAGAGWYAGQRASLAGAEGHLREIGEFQAAWRAGRIAVEVGGTLVRLFEDRLSFVAAQRDVDPEAGPRRRDAGDYRVATLVQLTPADRAGAVLLRFGTRLPTTDNRVGLERDRTDFFALVGGQIRREGMRLSAEAGVGINGTRDDDLEQADVLVYALGAEYRRGWIAPVLSLVGQKDGFDGWSMRGNEDLSEVRAGVRAGGPLWLQILWVRGLTDFSPRSGLLLRAGLVR